jgi:hypothetical protein
MMFYFCAIYFAMAWQIGDQKARRSACSMVLQVFTCNAALDIEGDVYGRKKALVTRAYGYCSEDQLTVGLQAYTSSG